MKPKQLLLFAWLVASTPFSPNTSAVGPLSTAFTYQGRLSAAGNAVNGLYEMQFGLFDAATNGTQIGATVTFSAVAVTNGLFTVSLDFGAAAFNGYARWLEISLNPSGSEPPTVTLAPRQPVTATPYALNAANLMSAAL